MTLTDVLTARLELIHQWYAGMVNPETGRLEYLYVPQTGAFARESSPIRDIASVWDVELIEAFLHRAALRPVVETSLRHYHAYLTERDGALILDARLLAEPSSIAHSAFMLLALLRAPTRDHEAIAALAEGILRQQRPDGSFRVYVEDLPDQGEELYAGEAMLALLEAYRQHRDPRYLSSVEQAFRFYGAHYYARGRVGRELLVFFANWQSQAGRLLFDCTERADLKEAVASYLFRMHDRIAGGGFYEAIERHPERQVSVEVACALEGLNEAYAVAIATSDARADRYRRYLCTALTYLLGLQCLERCADRERGGFGMALGGRTQRIDVTGHAASAFMKTLENRVECALASA